MKKVMTRAWEIAKEAVVKFGGKVKEYFAESLRMAWAEFKKGANKMEKLEVAYNAYKEARPNSSMTIDEFEAEERRVLSTNNDVKSMVKTWDEWLDAKIETHKGWAKESKEVASYQAEAEKAFSAFLDTVTAENAFDKEVEFTKFNRSLLAEINGEGNQEKSIAFRQTGVKVRKYISKLSRGDVKWENKPFTAGPIYDNDSKPTFY